MNINATMESAENTIRKAAEGNRSTFKDVKEDVATLKRDTVGALANNVESGLEATKDKYAEMCEFVKKNPAVSVLIAAGVGALTARVLGR